MLPFPSPGDVPDPGIEPGSSALQADPLPLSHLQVLLLYSKSDAVGRGTRKNSALPKVWRLHWHFSMQEKYEHAYPGLYNKIEGHSHQFTTVACKGWEAKSSNSAARHWVGKPYLFSKDSGPETCSQECY